MLQDRFLLSKTLSISERVEKSPNLINEIIITDNLTIYCADKDKSSINTVADSYLKAYNHAKNWFGITHDISIELWLASELDDLQYMTCLKCNESFLCAPCSRGRGVIICLSPQGYQREINEQRFLANLAHECAHIIIRSLSQASDFTMKRKQDNDLPMWLEEGLCQIIQSELDLKFKNSLENMAMPSVNKYALEELWDDLSSCNDVNMAYLQSYKITGLLLNKIGKAGILELMGLHISKDAIWDDVVNDAISLKS